MQEWRANEASKGWEIYIGKFELIDSRSGFKRYIAYSQLTPLDEVTEELQKLAEANNLKYSNIIKTTDLCYTYRQFLQIFLIKEGEDIVDSDLRTIQRALEAPLQKRGSIVLAFEEKIPYRASNSCILDINEIVNPIHKDLIQGLDNIIFPKA